MLLILKSSVFLKGILQSKSKITKVVVQLIERNIKSSNDRMAKTATNLENRTIFNMNKILLNNTLFV